MVKTSGTDYSDYQDIDEFIEILNRLDTNPTPEARHLFNQDKEIIITRAPGRLDVMGGIADYSGSLVLQMPIREAVLVAIQKADDHRIQIISLNAEENHRSPYFEMSLHDFEDQGKPISYSTSRNFFAKNPKTSWAAYIAGAFLVLSVEKSVSFETGAKILIRSNVPEGKGVSSSAALEVSAMQAIVALFNIRIEARELALLCQKVENLIVGAPCGVMDQMTAVFGEENRLMALLCQPAELQESVAIPDEISLWGLDSGIRHSVSGADYSSVRIGAFMGYRIIAQLSGLKAEQKSEIVSVKDPLWNGYLANIPPSFFEQNYASNLPERIAGRKFLDEYGGTTDHVTRIDPEHQYTIRVPTRHPIHENFRVKTFSQLLASPITNEKLSLLGELMFQSHASYSACGLGSEGTDLLVRLVRKYGPKNGLFGAKITGGGSGGTVAVIGRQDAQKTIDRIIEEYEKKTGYQPYLFQKSSDGALKFGYLSLKAL